MVGLFSVFLFYGILLINHARVMFSEKRSVSGETGKNIQPVLNFVQATGDARGKSVAGGRNTLNNRVAEGGYIKVF